jgi:hypothetical protein
MATAVADRVVRDIRVQVAVDRIDRIDRIDRVVIKPQRSSRSVGCV